MKEDLFEDIISKFFKGQATPHEKAMLVNYIKQDPGCEELFYYHLSKHEMESPQYLPEVEEKLEVYRRYLQGGMDMPSFDFHNREEQIHLRHRNYAWWLAASVIFLISTGIYFFQDTFLYTTHTAGNGMIKEVTLEDGSTVTLNGNSSIKVHRDFLGQENREVWIKGEAFFEVAKRDDRMKFVVHTSNFDVEVLGTKFNVSNRRGVAEVILSEGKVKLVAKDQDPLIMNPGELVTVSADKGLFEKEVVEPEKHAGWRHNRLVFDNTPLAEVAQIIQDQYGINVIVSDSLLAARQFTGTLPNNDLSVILLALETAYSIEVDHREDRIVFK